MGPDAAGQLSDARAYFADEGVPFPPVPDHLADRVERRGGREWGFGGPDVPLIDREAFLEAVVADPAVEFLRFGREGYSETSQCVCYFVATGRVAVLLQVQWGGYDFDLAGSAERLRATWAGVGRLLELVDAPGPRVVVERSFLDLSKGWALLTDAGPEWHAAEQDLLAEAYASVRKQ
jgi:hypothetical protein